MSISNLLKGLESQLSNINSLKVSGRILAIKNNLIEVLGLSGFSAIGDFCTVHSSSKKITCEIVGFSNEVTLLMPYNEIEGLKVNDKVELVGNCNIVNPDSSWLGRIINGMGIHIDSKDQLIKGTKGYSIKSSPPNPNKRNQVKDKIDLGVKAIDVFTSCCFGQRMGIFAGSGVGKSVLISMLARYAKTGIKVIGLIGERGREVQEFINEYLGEEGLKQSIIIVATGDEPALIRRRAAYLTITIAEYFRDLGEEVLCIIDSVTRFAMAQREIGLATGEPPSSKGYTPSVFSELPKLLERAGPGTSKGNITGLFTVLVDGDDHNEPIADAVRGILDGHIVLDRAIAERGRFPAIDILKSISRTMPKCNSLKEQKLVSYARRLMATYNEMQEMIKIGAYKKGSDNDIDTAIKYYGIIEKFLSQHPDESSSMNASYNSLARLIEFKEYYENTSDSN